MNRTDTDLVTKRTSLGRSTNYSWILHTNIYQKGRTKQGWEHIVYLPSNGSVVNVTSYLHTLLESLDAEETLDPFERTGNDHSNWRCSTISASTKSSTTAALNLHLMKEPLSLLQSLS